MSKKTNYNSIVFLTTLSVYLGLALVGGAPQVFSQAALTRDFDIKNEIEFKDDLDNKPDNEDCGQLKATTDERDNQFIKEYARNILALLKKGYFPQLKGYEITVNARYQSLEDADELFSELFPEISKELAVDSFHWTADKDKFFVSSKLKSKFENRDISAFGSAFNASLNHLLCEPQNRPENVILKNTEISYENNQIFIVTRLPRASIDELLAPKVAQ